MGYMTSHSKVDQVDPQDKEVLENAQEPQEEKYTEWDVDYRGDYYPYIPPTKLAKKVKPGYYKVKYNQKLELPYISPVSIGMDDLISFPEQQFEGILQDIKTFWSRKEKYEEYGFIHKRGILLYGPPGSGKSSLIQLAVEDLISVQNGVLFSIDSARELDYFSSFVHEVFREIEPNTPMIVIVEDIDGYCDDGDIESKLLQILDGVNHFANTITIATTNYLDKLPDRIKSRPSRFDRRYMIDNPTESMRLFYLEQKVHEGDLTKAQLTQWAEDTEGMSIAHLKELIASVIVMGTDYDEALEQLKKMKNTLPQSAYGGERRPAGF